MEWALNAATLSQYYITKVGHRLILDAIKVLDFHVVRMLAAIIMYVMCVISRANTWKVDIACQQLLSYLVWQEKFLLKLQHKKVSICAHYR